MDIHGWALALEQRRNVQMSINRGAYTPSRMSEFIEKNARSIGQLFRHSATRLTKRHGYSGYWYREEQLNEITIGEVASNWREIIHEDPFVATREQLILGSPEAASLDPEVVSHCRTSIQGLVQNYSRRLYLSVDGDAPERELVEQFTQALRDHKARIEADTSKKAKVTARKSDFMLWVRNQVLPYIDLTQWARVNGTALPNHKLGEILFPDECEVSLEERVRKSIKPLAKKLISESFCRSIHAQSIGIWPMSERHSVPEKK